VVAQDIEAGRPEAVSGNCVRTLQRLFDLDEP
jgi:hypothetical protein